MAALPMLPLLTRSRMYLIMLPSVTHLVPVCRLLSVCSGGSSGKQMADKRLLFCKQAFDLPRLCLALFQTASFLSPLSLNLCVTNPQGRFNGITVRSMRAQGGHMGAARTSGPLPAERGCRGGLRKDALFLTTF